MPTASKVLEIRDSSKPYKDSILINIRKKTKSNNEFIFFKVNTREWF